MRPKSLILLSLALGCGLIASLGINQVMSKGSPAAAPAQETEAVYVCAKDIPINEVIAPDMVKLERWPSSKVPPDAIRRLEDVVQRRARQPLLVDDILRDARLYGRGEGSDNVSSLIQPGYRVVAIEVDAESAGGNLLKPGDRVDVMVHLAKHSGSVVAARTVTFLQNAKIFAVNSTVTKGDNDGAIAARTVSLEVLPKQTEIVSLARQLGKITLALRSPKDRDEVELSSGTDANALLQLLEQKSTPATAASGSSGEPASPLSEQHTNFLAAMQALAGGGPPTETSDEPPPPKDDAFRMQLYLGNTLTEWTADEKTATLKSGELPNSTKAPLGLPADMMEENPF